MLDNVTSIVTSAGIPSGYPEQLHGVDISFIYTEDLRFRKHAMVNISWSRPRGIIIIIRATCVKPCDLCYFRLSNYRAISNKSFFRS